MKDNINSHADNQDKLDEISVLQLELMDQLITCKKEIEDSLREGYFLLGKARYIMGVQSVSMLQIPSDECDFETLYRTSVSEEPLAEFPSLTNHQFSIHLNQQNVVKDLEEDNSSLRKRGTREEDVKSEEETGVEDVKCKRIDPLNWFSALPPQSLRKAQQHFKQALLKSAECATIQSKLNALNE